jgi:nucleoside-diphosphate-sugar epimerase
MRVKDARQTFLGVWIKNPVEGKPIEVWGDGLQVRDFNYVDDVTDAMLMAALSEQSNGQIYNLGSPEHVNLKDLAALMIKVHGKGDFRIIPFPEDRKPIDIGDYYADYRKIREALKWNPRNGLEQGLTRTLQYYYQFIHEYL